MPLRLKSLELHGYKTFASRTTFEFADGITAIVGPNGSGKSNIADALRWVLGEQSYGLLRAKKTEDMIFAGSESRTRASMASVSILFDNTADWLPVDFSEVSMGRRAYRDGRNDYVLNSQHVRLKDIKELLAQSGLSERTYTILGQGLVDASLALKADERRKLFEVEIDQLRTRIVSKHELTGGIERAVPGIKRVSGRIGRNPIGTVSQGQYHRFGLKNIERSIQHLVADGPDYQLHGVVLRDFHQFFRGWQHDDQSGPVLLECFHPFPVHRPVKTLIDEEQPDTAVFRDPLQGLNGPGFIGDHLLHPGKRKAVSGVFWRKKDNGIAALRRETSS